MAQGTTGAGKGAAGKGAAGKTSSSKTGLSEPIEAWLSQRTATAPGPTIGIGQAEFDVLIIGSGYGGAVAAARLAGASAPDRQKLTVALFERGREIEPGSFPDSWADLPGEVRWQRHNADELIGKADALFEFRGGKTVNVLLGNGLGGGSLINAAVAEAPTASVWQDGRWPLPLRDPAVIGPFLRRARESLGARRIDQWSAAAPQKLATMQHLAASIDPAAVRYRPVDLAIDGASCIQCGDCMSGCNLNAKNTLPKTYLASARAHGVAMYTGVTVSHLSRAPDQTWRVHCFLTNSKGHPGLQAPFVVSARQVILAAGALGSTEILQRSQHLAEQAKTRAGAEAQMQAERRAGAQAGAQGDAQVDALAGAQAGGQAGAQAAHPPALPLHFSSRLGQHFSCNGDMVWAGYAQAEPVNAMAEPCQPLQQRRVGPTIAAMIDLRDQAQPHVIQDASSPGPLQRLMHELLTSMAVGYRMILPDTERRRAGQDVDAVDPDKMARSALYLAMGRDRANGRLHFQAHTPHSNTGLAGRLQMQWGAAETGPLARSEAGQDEALDAEPVYAAAEKTLAAVAQLGGTLIANPLWRAGPKALLDELAGPKRPASTITVHPLGGCPMADDIRGGVVNHFGAVFMPHEHQIDALYPGLYVLDGAIIPTALGINPLLTIAALAERAIPEIARHHGWHLRQRLIEPQAKAGAAHVRQPDWTPAPPERAAFRFQELMEWSASDTNQHPVLPNEWGDMATPPLALVGAKRVELETEFLVGQDGKLAQFLRDPQRSVSIGKASLRVHYSDGRATDQIALCGSVDWLIESDQGPDQKRKDGLMRYLASRALADVAGRTDLSDGERRMVNRAIRLLNWIKMPLPNWLAAPLGARDPRLANIFALASHTGGHRTLRYQLQECDPKTGQPQPGWCLIGQKDVTYTDGSNIWRSLSTMPCQLSRFDRPVGTLRLTLNWRKVFENNVFQFEPPHSGAPRNPDMWVDAVSLVALFARAMARLHFWSFRLPHVQQAVRVPGLPSGQYSRWYPLQMRDRAGHTVYLGLTHFPANWPRPDLPPLLMLHGFGASGLQFAAPGMQTTLADYFNQQGRDVWLAELRTSIVMNRHLPDKQAQWSLDEVAQDDIPFLVHKVLELCRGPKSGPARAAAPQQLDVLAHCIGSAMFHVAVLSGKLQAEDGKTSLIRRAALLQVGPIFTVSKGNKLRGYASYFFGDGLKQDFVDSTTDKGAQDWKTILIDRFLNTYPVPESEIHAEEPQRSLDPVEPGTEWQANYLRSAGVFGRLFDIKQLSWPMLNQLGNLLGRTNMRTFRQILESLMRNRLVDQDGRNVYVNAARFAAYYRFPLRFFHGNRNDVFSEWGVRDSVEQLRSAHGWSKQLDRNAADRNAADMPQSDASPFSWRSLEGFGHLDPLIGQHAPERVFPLFAEYLNQANPPWAEGTEPTPYSLREPDYGPVLGWQRGENGQTWQRVWLHARETAGAPVYIAVFRKQGDTVEPGSLRLFPVNAEPQFKCFTVDIPYQNGEVWGFAVLHQGCEAGSGGDVLPIQFPPGLDLAASLAKPPKSTNAIKPGVAQRDGKPTHHALTRIASPGRAVPPVQEYERGGQSLLPVAADTLATQLNSHLASAPPEKKHSLHRTVCLAASALPAASEPVRLALGSCRYSGTMVEMLRNNHAFAQLDQVLQANQCAPACMLLMGDQIYLDATGGVIDSGQLRASISLYHRSLNRVASAQPLAAASVFARLPAYMMLDDHEIGDNWNRDDDDKPAKRRSSRMALSAFAAFQWSHGPRNPAWRGRTVGGNGAKHFWYHFEQGPLALFMLDTRLERSAVRAAAPRLISPEQFQALEKWLQSTRKNGQLRLIVSPSQIIDPGEAHGLRTDGWAAYPADLARLCRLLLAEPEQNQVAILCGDLHAHGLFHMELQDKAQNRGQEKGKNKGKNKASAPNKRIPVIVASPLYAPYPFANQGNKITPAQADIALELADGLQLCYRIEQFNTEYQGFVQLALSQAGGNWQAQLFQVDGRTPLFPGLVKPFDI
jgi:choline dehydrogenase-like flavoprotein